MALESSRMRALVSHGGAREHPHEGAVEQVGGAVGREN